MEVIIVVREDSRLLGGRESSVCSGAVVLAPYYSMANGESDGAPTILWQEDELLRREMALLFYVGALCQSYEPDFRSTQGRVRKGPTILCSWGTFTVIRDRFNCGRRKFVPD